MIFVTVGTHEDAFDRLIKEIDELKGHEILEDEIFIQIGYSNYKPKHCRYEELLGFQDMDEYVKQARIVITHGGPGSIMLPLRYGKVPIVVPRQSKFKEHVDDHQVLFAKKLESLQKIMAIYDISDLNEAIKRYGSNNIIATQEVKSNADNFAKALDKICLDLVQGKNKGD
jgi:UDP-N-acetylglucosamine transferase subunit ALG13